MCKDWHSSGWWQRKRKHIKARYEWQCCICGTVSKSVEVDHVIPYDNNHFTEDKKREMFIAERNMWVLCPHCHRVKTSKFDGGLKSKDIKIGAASFYKNKIKKDLYNNLEVCS